MFNLACNAAMLQEGSYQISGGERGSSLGFVASEPITGCKTDWVAVPANTLLVMTREKGGFLSVMRAPIDPLAQCNTQQQEVCK